MSEFVFAIVKKKKRQVNLQVFVVSCVGCLC
jgi:hypothetical protein